MKARQRGVALITAMLIVAIVAALATTLALGQQVWLRQTQNLVDLTQAELLRRGALEFASSVLILDAKANQTDTLKDEWAREAPPLPVEGGAILVRIRDAQGLFNLNNLVLGGVQNPDNVQLFAQLLTSLDLPPTLVPPVVDWIDTDSNLTPGGAEDLDYLNHDPAYRAANQPLRSVDELLLVKGFTREVVDKLRPYVIALPAPGGSALTPVNINTAAPLVLAALTGVDPTQAEQITRTLKDQPLPDVNAFKTLVPGGQKLKPGSYDVKSAYFIVSVETRIGRTQRRTEALIERPTGNRANATVLWHREPPVTIVLDEDET